MINERVGGRKRRKNNIVLLSLQLNEMTHCVVVQSVLKNEIQSIKKEKKLKAQKV